MTECCFTSRNSDCSGGHSLINHLEEDVKLSVYSELKLLPSRLTENFQICSGHLERILIDLANRRRRKTCSISSFIRKDTPLEVHTAKRAGERNLTGSMFHRIAEITGIFIPVGTAICRQCREKLLSTEKTTNEKQSDHSEITMDAVTVIPKEVDENFNSIKSEHNDLTVEPSAKRRRTSNMPSTSVYEYYDNGKQTSDSLKIEIDSHQDILSQHSHASEASEDSIIGVEKREMLNKFLGFFQISPVKELKKPLFLSSERTQRRYAVKAKQCLDSILTVIAPNEGELLYNAMLTQEEEKRDKVLVEVYLRGGSWQFRRQVLSVLVQEKSLEECQKIIPSITNWRYYEAKKHGKTVGVGNPVSSTTGTRQKIDIASLEHFVDFITSTHIIKDLPFGQKTLRMESGEIIKIPNVVRSLSASTIVDQYQQMCEIDNISPLGKSTCYKILTECSASFRKSLEGLDNYVMEGSRAFQILEEHLDEMNNKDLKLRLMRQKHYLKTDFKVHLSNDTSIQDHCMAYSLSVQNPEFRQHCDHEHNLRCKNCLELEHVLTDIQQTAVDSNLDHKDAILFKIEKAIYDIKELQKHLVRSKKQEMARSQIIEEMSSSMAIITCDWAMKFLPRRYREGMIDWFGKRGLNWHVSVVLMKKQEIFSTKTYLHIFKNQTCQDSKTTAAVICNTVEEVKQSQPHINGFHIFSDNAGCYKSTTTLTTLKSHLGEDILTYNFSEAQNGKGPCDRRAAHAKAAIKKYVNEGHDVISAEDMKVALERTPMYSVKVVDIVEDLDVMREDGTNAIKKISAFYNFKYENEGLRMWQAYNVGEGKLVPCVELKPQRNSVSLTVQSNCNEDCTYKDVTGKSTQRNHYFCQKEGCIKEFKDMQSLEQHMLRDTCEYQLERTCDKVKLMYSKKLERNIATCSSSTNANDAINSESDICMGWALKEKKKKTNFTKVQKDFLIEKFNMGKVGGNKVDPYNAAEEMRLSNKFSKEQFLTAQQISSFFPDILSNKGKHLTKMIS